MATNYVLVIAIVVLVACGTVLVLERSLSRILIGFVMLGNGVNLTYLVASGPSGDAPIIGMGSGEMTDPLPQAMVLTAIVISLATIGFLLALSYRLWQVSGTDDVPDDAEDARIQRLALEDQTSSTYDPSEASTTTSDELAEEGVVSGAGSSGTEPSATEPSGTEPSGTMTARAGGDPR